MDVEHSDLRLGRYRIAHSQLNRDGSDLAGVGAQKLQPQDPARVRLERVFEIFERGEEFPIRAQQNIAGKKRSAACGA